MNLLNTCAAAARPAAMALLMMVPGIARGIETADTAIPAPGPALGCATLEDVIKALDMTVETSQVSIFTFVEKDPATGDIIITAIAFGVPTSMNFRLHDGCVIARWEKPL
jgi:recombinational DNA repair protein RecR